MNSNLSNAQNKTDSFKIDILKIILIAITYFLSHKLAFFFPDSEKVLAAIWPAGGIGLASLLLMPRRLWPSILITLFVTGNFANFTSDRNMIGSMGFMTANLIESLSCALLISHFCGEGVRFNKVKDIIFLFLSALLINAGTGLIGAATASFTSGAPFWDFWITWWIADGLGIFLITPFVVSWINVWNLIKKIPLKKIIEFVIFLVFWSVIAKISFETKEIFLHPYMLIVLLSWPAFRFGQKGVTLACVLMAGFAITSSSVTLGPSHLEGDNFNQRLLLVQLFLSIASGMGFLLSAAYFESKTANKTSLETENKLRTLGDNLPNGFIYQLILEPGGSRKFIYISAGIETLHGINPDDVIKDASLLYSQIFEEDRLRILDEEKISAKNLTVFNEIVRVKAGITGIKWVRITSSPQLLSDGGVLWNGLEIDITDKKLAEDALLKSEAELKKAQKIAHLGSYSWEIPIGKLEWSDELKSIWGIESDYIDFELLVNRIHPDDYERVSEVGRLAREENHGFNIEYRIVRPDGSIRYLYDQAQITRDENNNPVKMFGTVLDLTFQKEIEIALRETERKKQLIFDTMTEGVALNELIYDENNEMVDYCIIDVNKAFYSTTDFNKTTDVIGKTATALYGMTSDFIKSFWFKHKDSKETLYSEMFRPTTNRHFYVSTSPIIDDKFITTFFDITERKQIEEMLKNSLREKELLLAEIHHRVKNNLQIVSSIINMETQYIDNPEVIIHLKNTAQRVHAMGLLHNKLYKSDDFEHIDMYDYLKSIFEHAINIQYSKAINITKKYDIENIFFNIETAMPCGLMVNEIITNSLKYAFNGVSEGEIGISIKFENEEYIMKIYDNGKGIPENINFEQNYKLGMQLIYALIDQLDGTVTLDRENGTMYTFTFKESIKNEKRLK